MDYQEIFGVPPEMDAWRLRIESAQPTEYGHYALVGVWPAGIEGSHQVGVIDEQGRPLSGVGVMFGFPGGNGPHIGAKPRVNHWRGAPSVLIGNYQETWLPGTAEHTYKTGGEDVWIWDIEGDELKLSSTIVKNCLWIPTNKFQHTGVRLLFQRRRVGIPLGEALEGRIRALEKLLGQ